MTTRRRRLDAEVEGFGTMLGRYAGALSTTCVSKFFSTYISLARDVYRATRSDR